MAEYIYKGESELVIPSLGLTLKQGDKFEAPEGLKVLNVVSTKTTKATPAPTQESEK